MFSISAIAIDGAVVDHAHDHRDLRQAGQLRGAPAAFAGDDLVTRALARVVDLAHDDRLDHALRADRLGQLGELALVHAAARLVLAGLQLIDRQLAQRCRRGWASSGAVSAAAFGPSRASRPRPRPRFFATLMPHFLLRFLRRGFAVCSRSRWRRSTSPARPR